MEDDFLMDSMILYIEKEIAAKFGTESIIDDFRDLKEHQFHFDICVDIFIISNV